MQHQVAGHRHGRRPVDDLSRVQADHRRREQPTLVAADVGDIGHPDLVGRLRREVAIEHVGRHDDAACGHAHLCPQALGLQQSLDAMAAAAFFGLPQVQGDLAIAIHRPAGQPVMLDQIQKPSMLLFASATPWRSRT